MSIDGPAGTIEAEIDTPGLAASAVGIVCHPHPVHGGTLKNKVVTTLSRALTNSGITALRFNFRGVGRSQGCYDSGRGELLDTLAVMDWAQQLRWPGCVLHLAGFSFGGAVAYRAALQRPVRSLVTVAPAVARASDASARPMCPWLVVYAADDDIVPPDLLSAWAARFDPPPATEVLSGAGHFFHGRLGQLRDSVTGFLARHEVPPC